MENKDFFKKYRARLIRAGILKSLFPGLIAAFIVTGIVALITWFTRISLSAVLGLSLGLGGAAALICIPVFYFLRFRPTKEGTARQLDALGLDERCITMCEFENDPSALASLQRGDAEERLLSVPAERLKPRVSPYAVLLTFCSLAFAVSFMTVSSLAAADVISGGGDIIGSNPKTEENLPSESEEYFTVNYLVYESGTGEISGKSSQTVKKGGYTSEVYAVPAEGYAFYAWVDGDMKPSGSQENPRVDLNVRSDITVYAMFYKPDNSTGGDPSQPDHGKEEEGGGSKPDPGDDKDPDESGGSDSGGSSEGGGSGGETPGRVNNGVIDGTQDYRENFDRGQFEKELEEDKSLPDDLKDLLGDYYDILKP